VAAVVAIGLVLGGVWIAMRLYRPQDVVWDRIQSEKVWLVATDASYPPFSTVDALKRMAESRELRMRIWMMLRMPNEQLAVNLDKYRTIGAGGNFLTVRAIKRQIDGALGSRGAWLKAPYADAPGQRGLQFLDDAKLRNLMSRAAMDGFQVAVHAIGDAANAQVLDALDELGETYKGDRRWRIEHAQIIDPADLPRFGKHGVVASMQPVHQTSDRRMAEARLGPQRLGGAYAWKAMLDNGVPLAFGSDYPVESPNPFPALAAAVSREDATGQPVGGWMPAQKIGLPEAFRAFTATAAYAGFAEDRIGSLTPGHQADFLLLDRDIFTAGTADLRAARPAETWIGGKRVWVAK